MMEVHMKILLFVFFILSAQAQHHHPTDKPSVHGMVIFGKSSIYLSHLPMFHNPHDYQALMEVTIASDPRTEEGLYTIVPEKFSLPEMMANPRPFKVEMYAGHFERGGKLIGTTIVKIKKVLLFKKLNPLGKRPAQLTYYSFGNGKDQFLVHKISSRPDFDHIIQVESGSSEIRELTFSHPDTQPLTAGKEIYFETGDLSH